MSGFKIKVKDVQDFVKSELVLYASGRGKRFFVRIHAGPNVERYVVETNKGTVGFAKAGEAVQHFNDS